jgi:hypothetical protein
MTCIKIDLTCIFASIENKIKIKLNIYDRTFFVTKLSSCQKFFFFVVLIIVLCLLALSVLTQLTVSSAYANILKYHIQGMPTNIILQVFT